MPDSKLIDRANELFALDYTDRLVWARLMNLRENARVADGWPGGQVAREEMRVPPGYTSVEALVMDVSDLAQTHGYLRARIEDLKERGE